MTEKSQFLAAAVIGALILSPAALAVEDETAAETAQEELQLSPEANDAQTEEFPTADAEDAAEGSAPEAVGDLPYTEPGKDRLENVHKLDATKGMKEQVPEMGLGMSPDKEAAADTEGE